LDALFILENTAPVQTKALYRFFHFFRVGRRVLQQVISALLVLRLDTFFNTVEKYNYTHKGEDNQGEEKIVHV